MESSSTKLAPLSVQKMALYPCLGGAYYQIRKNWLCCETASCNPDLTGTAGARRAESSVRQSSARASGKYMNPLSPRGFGQGRTRNPPTAHSPQRGASNCILPPLQRRSDFTVATSSPFHSCIPCGLWKMSQFSLVQRVPDASHLMHIQKQRWPHPCVTAATAQLSPGQHGGSDRSGWGNPGNLSVLHWDQSKERLSPSLSTAHSGLRLRDDRGPHIQAAAPQFSIGNVCAEDFKY